MHFGWRGAALAAALAAGVHSVWAQPINGCPAGQAMQSSDPSGKKITCVPLPDVSALQGSINAEAAARAAADQALSERIDRLTESDIVGRWAVSGTASCLQSSRGFTPDFSPVVTIAPPGTPPIVTVVSQLTHSINGTRTFNAGGAGTSDAVLQTLAHAGLVFGVLGTGPTGAANVSTLSGTFVWQIQPDGTLFIEDDRAPNVLAAPPSRIGSTVVIENRPPFVGHISSDRRTILLTHPGMSIETSVSFNAAGVEQSRTPRFCHRQRTLIRLPD
jgi:hypothetical protein